MKVVKANEFNFELISEEGNVKYVFFATGIHLIVFLLLLSFSVFNGFSPLSKTSKIKIVGPSIRVDIVALPKLTIQEKKAMELPTTPIDQSASSTEPVSKKNDNPDDANSFKEKGGRENFLNKLKKLANANEEKPKERNKKNNSFLNDMKNLIFEGNKISKGSSLQGEQLDNASDDIYTYGQLVVEKVRQNWQLPSYLKENNYSNQVQVFISTTGKVLKIQI